MKMEPFSQKSLKTKIMGTFWVPKVLKKEVMNETYISKQEKYCRII